MRVCIAVARIEEVVEWGPVMDPGSLYHISFLLSISFQYLDDWSLGKRDSVLGDLTDENFRRSSICIVVSLPNEVWHRVYWITEPMDVNDPNVDVLQEWVTKVLKRSKRT